MIQNSGMGWGYIIVFFFILAAMTVKIKGPFRKRKKKSYQATFFSLYSGIGMQ
jgi:hypothetical protein